MTKGFYQYGADPDEVMLSTYVDREHDVDAYCFLHGMCTIFAIALNQEFGYPILMLYDSDEKPVLDSLIHIFCEKTDSAGIRHFVDARGVTGSEEAFLDSFEGWFDRPAYKQVEPKDVECLIISDMGESTYRFFLSCAKQLIGSYRNYYNEEGIK